MRERDVSDDFEAFWRAYPRRVGKGAARREWHKQRPTPVIVHKMHQALAWQCQQEQWTRDGGAFIPHPRTWLHQERWDDEPMTVQAATPVDGASAWVERMRVKLTGGAL